MTTKLILLLVSLLAACKSTDPVDGRESSFAASSAARQVNSEDFPALFESFLKSGEQQLPGLSRDLRTKVRQLNALVASRGVQGLHPFALRGVGAASLSLSQTGRKPGDSGASLGDLKSAGFLSEQGGNFYIFDPKQLGEEITSENFIVRLFGTISAVTRYASRETHPIILFVDLKKFPIINSRGNDGIDSNFPANVNWQGSAFLFRCLDVGMVTRPGVSVRKVVTRANSVPESSIVRLIGERGIPGAIQGSFSDVSDSKALARILWVFNEMLTAWLPLN